MRVQNTQVLNTAAFQALKRAYSMCIRHKTNEAILTTKSKLYFYVLLKRETPFLATNKIASVQIRVTETQEKNLFGKWAPCF